VLQMTGASTAASGKLAPIESNEPVAEPAKPEPGKPGAKTAESKPPEPKRLQSAKPVKAHAKPAADTKNAKSKTTPKKHPDPKHTATVRSKKPKPKPHPGSTTGQ